MKYRPEIDGLRAVAVVPVILFHAGFSAFSGGFVGVDIFFVISGYLITSILLNDLEKNRFSLLTFYERRARRILPALFTVMLACLPFAWMWMTTTQFKDFAQSLGAVVLFGSNILFWLETDYFAAASELKPLLHTWSLAVEEQFYVIFPLLLAGIWGLEQRRIALVFTVLLLLSLALCEWGWRSAPSANFFLAPFRAWELLTGSLCALALARGSVRPSAVAGWTGVLLIVASIVYFDGATPFPSLWALLPVAGTALIVLFAGPATLPGRILGWPPLVGIGLVSYSAYLWHQPLFAFARIRMPHEPGAAVMLGLSLVALVLAALSWKFVEQPFRQGTTGLLPKRSQVFAASAAAGAAFLLMAAGGHLTDGAGFRTAPSGVPFAELKINDQLRRNYGLSSACTKEFNVSEDCTTGPDPKVAFWGDSYTMHLVQAWQASPSTAPMRQLTRSDCAGFVSLASINLEKGPGGARDCLDQNAAVLKFLAQTPEIELVVLSSPYNLTSDGGRTADLRPIPDDRRGEIVIEAMRETVVALRRMGKSVVVVSPPPKMGEDIGQCLAFQRLWGGAPEACDFTPQDFNGNTRTVYAFLDEISAFVPVVRLDHLICADGTCRTLQDGNFVYRDGGHLSKNGSAWLGRTHDLAGLIFEAAEVQVGAAR